MKLLRGHLAVATLKIRLGLAAALIGVGAFVGLVVLAAAAVELRLAGPGSLAVDDIPPPALAAYQLAGTTCPALDWAVLAGIGKIESDHGRITGGHIGTDGRVEPLILGPPLDGSGVGGNLTPIPIGPWVGRYGVTGNWMRAVGPMQFLPPTYARHRHHPDGDPHNITHAALAAANLLCSTHPNRRITDLRRALLAYNRSDSYVDEVLEWAEKYRSIARPAGDALLTTCPVAGPHHFIDSWGFPRSGGRRHQGVDIMARTGVPVVAPVAGTVTHRYNSLGGRSFHLTGDDGNRYYGTHLSAYASSGEVQAGTVIGYVGDDGNARGAPHLHFEIHPGGGAAVNPYPYVAAACSGAT